jgi:CheY-like chemotaxis protein
MNDHILIIDSDKIILRRLRELLTSEGFSIMTVTDKKEALNLCKQLPIRLIIGAPSELGIDTKENPKV